MAGQQDEPDQEAERAQHGQHGEENAPCPRLCDVAAHQRPHGHGAEEADVDEGGGDGEAIDGEALDQRGDGDHEQEPGAEPLDDAAGDEEPRRRRQRRQDRAEDEQPFADKVEMSLPEALEQVGGEHGPEGVAGVAEGRREPEVILAGVESRREDRAQQFDRRGDDNVGAEG